MLVPVLLALCFVAVALAFWFTVGHRLGLTMVEGSATEWMEFPLVLQMAVTLAVATAAVALLAWVRWCFLRDLRE